MAPNLPSRYQPQVRLGRDGDVEEWLATDVVLDRPVLIRVLNPDAPEERRTRFLAAARAAATVSHDHLEDVYDVGNHEATAHAVVEWNGGVTISDRLSAGDTIPLADFVPNAAGLAEGLAALHRSGIIHGAIDTGAIHFSASHPAKLGAFGRPPVDTSEDEDTRALARTLRLGVTGIAESSIDPSQVVEGLSTGVDRALGAAEDGEYDASDLAAALRAIRPAPEAGSRTGGWSWTWLVPAGLLVVAALLVAIIGTTLDADPDSPFLFPASPSPAEDAVSTTSATTTPPSATSAPEEDVLPYSVAAFDPFGEGTENDARLGALADGSTSSSWGTERYFGQLVEIGKPGVGVTFADLPSPPALVEMRADPGTRWELYWTEEAEPDPALWTRIAAGTMIGPTTEVQLPPREGGVWLLWITALPEPEEGVFATEVQEITFRP